MPSLIRSEAFHRAALRSERYRILGILIVFSLFFLLDVTRSILAPGHHEHIFLRDTIFFFTLFFAYQVAMLWIARRAERAGRPVRTWLWILNTLIDCSLPTAALYGLTLYESYMGPYRALLTSTVLLYTFFIILSTLRLSPFLSLLSGLTCAANYTALYLYTGWAYPDYHDRKIMPAATYISYPIMLLAAGAVAATVAWQIRRHVVAALQEAETHRKLDRIEQDLHIARSIQKGLLPKHPPAVSGYDIAGWSEPADQTGGDYYDWMELPGGRVLFTIADAAGHGIGPALLIAACRAYFRAVAMHDDPLERITTLVDELITKDCPSGRFITAAVALLEPREHRLSLYSAGHAPTYFYHAAQDSVAEFEADQPPLGIGFSDGTVAHARVISFEPGDALVLVTDGMFECANATGELLGMERLGSAICRHQKAGASALIQKLHEEVLAFSGTTAQGDDLTVVAIQRTRM